MSSFHAVLTLKQCRINLRGGTMPTRNGGPSKPPPPPLPFPPPSLPLLSPFPLPSLRSLCHLFTVLTSKPGRREGMKLPHANFVTLTQEQQKNDAFWRLFLNMTWLQIINIRVCTQTQND